MKGLWKAGHVAEMEEGLPNMHKDLDSIPSTTCNKAWWFMLPAPGGGGGGGWGWVAGVRQGDRNSASSSLDWAAQVLLINFKVTLKLLAVTGSPKLLFVTIGTQKKNRLRMGLWAESLHSVSEPEVPAQDP